MYYTGPQLIERVKQLPSFKTIPYNYWIIGVRSSEDKPNSFDDVFNLMKGEELILQTKGTTNPGTPILKGGYLKYNKVGAAVVVADEIYYGVWRYGMHLGTIPALRQIRPILIGRDGDGDSKSSDKNNRTTGLFGINFHPDQRETKIDTRGDERGVDGWSAGCQVLPVFNEYKQFIEAVKDQTDVTYCLLNEFSI